MSEKQTPDHDLEIELNLKVPAPLDPHIASVSIRTGSNNPADYFDLLLSASFGSEYVTLDSGDDRIEVKISIQKAEIKLNSVNCSFALIHNVDTQSENWQVTEKAVDKRGRASERRAGGSFSLNRDGVSGDLSVGSNRSSSGENSLEYERDRNVLPYRVLSDDTIQVGYANDFKLDVHGRVIDESIGIRVVPTQLGKSIGVLARTRVRERWITIDEANPIKASSTFRRLWQSMEAESKDSSRKRELFGKLIAHLIAKNLQEKDDDVHATLCAAAVVFSPSNSRSLGIGSPARENRIKIDPTLIEAFLQADKTHEVEILRDLGVEFETLDEPLSRAATFANFWNNEFGHYTVYVTSGIDNNFVLASLSRSLGLELRVSGHYPDGSTPHSAIAYNRIRMQSAQELIERFEGNYFGIESLIGMGALVKGNTAYEMARIAGFSQSYQTFQRRIRPSTVMSSFGYLVSIGDLLRAIGQEGFIDELMGEEFFLPSIVNFEDNVDNEEIP